MKKLIKILNWLLIIGMVIGDVYLLVHDLGINKTDRIATYIVLIPILCVPYLLKKIFKYEVSEEISFIYYIFIFLAQFLGSGVNLYNKTIWFDKFTHFLSGILSGFIALILLVEFKKDPTKHILFNITYILGIVFLIAGVWECFEFGMDTFTGSNLQHAIETNVGDTMGDMIAAFGGSIIFLIFYVMDMLKKQNGFITYFIKSL